MNAIHSGAAQATSVVTVGDVCLTQWSAPAHQQTEKDRANQDSSYAQCVDTSVFQDLLVQGVRLVPLAVSIVDRHVYIL